MARDFQALFAKAEWFSPELNRDWVRYRNDDNPMGVCWHVPSEDGSPSLSVIVPTADADRGGYFAQLLHALSLQDFQDFELWVLKGDRRQGRAINICAALAKGRYILTLDDDSSLPDRSALSKMIAAMEQHADIGMAGGNNTVPESASPFVQRVMRQVPRRSWEPVSHIVDSDLAEHPCLMIRADIFRQVGGENEMIPRGLDPYLRQAFREAGVRVVVLPDVIYHHLPPTSWPSLLGQMYRNGVQAAYANIHFPEWVIETPATHGDFTLRVPLWKRVLRFPWNMFKSLFLGKWVWVLCEASYAWGFLRGWLKERKHAR